MTAARPRRRLRALGLVLAGLALAVAATEYLDRRARPADGGDTGPPLLLPAPVEELGAVEVGDRGRLHRFERADDGRWFYHGAHGGGGAEHAHAPDPALAERIAAVLGALGRARVERQFPLDGPPAAYGVAAPDVIVLVYRRGSAQPLAQYAVGHVAPDTMSQYVMAVGRPVVGTVPKYQIDNLLALVQEAADAGRSGGAAGAR